MKAIDTNVKAEPTSCRQLGDWFEKLAEAHYSASAAARKAATTAGSFWEGEASEAFSAQMVKRSSDVNELGDAADRARQGLELFADDITTVRSRMRQAMDLAHDVGLTVTGTVIHQPPGGAADTASGGVGGDMPGLNPKAQAQAEAERKLEAFREIEATVDEARRYERTAHRSLIKALEGSNTLIDAVASTKTWISRGFVAAGTIHGAATTHLQNASTYRAFAENLAKLEADSTLPASTRAAHMQTLLANAGMEERAAASNARLLGNVGRTRAGDFVLKRLSPTMGGQKNTRLNTVGRAFGVVGVGAAAVFTAQDIADGKPIGKSIWTNFGALGAGTAATAAVTGVAATAGAPVTLTGLGVGFAASTAWTYFQDNDLRDLYRDMGGDGIDAPDDQSDERRKARYGW